MNNKNYLHFCTFETQIDIIALNSFIYNIIYYIILYYK